MFTPTDPGYAEDAYSLKLFSQPSFVTVAGRGIVGWDIPPELLDFGFVPLGSSRSLNMTVTNNFGQEGTAPAHDLDLGEHIVIEDTTCETGTTLPDDESC